MLILFISCHALAQISVVTTGVPFLLISPSPEANGQGCNSVSRITDDPFAINFNPAHLGLSSFQNYIMISFYPTKTNWLPGFGFDDLTFNTTVLSCGFNLEKYTDLPLSIGVAYSKIYLDYGTFTLTLYNPTRFGTYHPEEHNDALSLGIGINLIAKIALGVTFRNIESNLAPFGIGQEGGRAHASGQTQDYGILVCLPLKEIFTKEWELAPGISPIFDLSFGSALTNVSEKKMVYIDKAQADPFPRNISLGTAIDIGLNFTRTNHKLLSFTWSRQADNLLVGRNGSTSYYRGGFGDLDFMKNIIQGKRTETIDLSQGTQLGIAEIVFIRWGSFVGTGNLSFTTKGNGLRASGFFKLLRGLGVVESTLLSFLIDHFDLRYDQSEYHTTEIGHPLDNTKFSSVSIVLHL